MEVYWNGDVGIRGGLGGKMEEGIVEKMDRREGMGDGRTYRRWVGRLEGGVEGWIGRVEEGKG